MLDLSIGLDLGRPAAGSIPTLFLDFVSGTTLDSRVTFTRASGGTRVNASGFIETVGNNIARFDYNPVTLALRGLLLEEQRTNLLLRSEEIDNASWGKTRSSVSANATTSPDGTVDADKLIEDTANNTHTINQNLTIATATSYTFSIYLKAAERAFARLLFGDTGGNNGVRVDVNLNTGAISTGTNGAGWTLLGASATAVGDGWYRVVLSGTSAAATTGTCVVYTATALGTFIYTGNGTSGLFVWGAQLELGAFSTSYIVTTSAQVTRVADSATITGSNFTPWFNATQGTLYAEFTPSTISGTRTAVAINDNTANESIRLRTVAADPFFTVTDGGVDQANIDAGTVAAGTTYKMAGAYAANDFATSINGGAAVTDLSGTLPTVTQMMLGNSAATNALNGHLRAIRYYRTRLTDGQLAQVTT